VSSRASDPITASTIAFGCSMVHGALRRHVLIERRWFGALVIASPTDTVLYNLIKYNAALEGFLVVLSPYTPGSVPTKLPGRSEKLQQFRHAAQRMDTDGRFVPRIHIDHGPRGVGKTSLLREAERIFGGYRIRTVSITADPNETLVRSILSELKLVVGASARFKKAALAAIESASVSIGVPGALSAGVTIKPVKDLDAASAKHFQRALKATLDSIVGDGDSGLAILIDEIQEADPASLRTIAYAWQEMEPREARAASQPRAAFFGVGLPGAPTKINKAVTFSERFSFEPLHGLSDAGAREALESTAADVGVGWDQRALDRGVAESAGYPYKVQLVGDFAWKAAANRHATDGLEPGDSITLPDVIAALPLVDAAMQTLFRSRWRTSSNRQQEMLAAIAGLGGRDIKRASLAQALNSETRAISVTRQRLLDKGLVDANKHGHLSFTVPGFAEFVLDQVNNE
jgi:hypothetical protein